MYVVGNPKNEFDLAKNHLFIRWMRASDKELDEFWARWIELAPDRSEMVRKAKDLIDSVQYRDNYVMEGDDYHTILDQLVQTNHEVNFGHQGEQRTLISRETMIWAAASVVLIAFVFAGVFTALRKNELPPTVAVQTITKVIPKGVKSTVMLPDGTLVKLNSSSTLEFPSSFSDTLREVFLTGQAFFDVVKNEKAPFIVHSANFSTLVLGTSFDIRSYVGESVHHVAVVSGKVRVATATGFSETLVPNEMTIYKGGEMILTSGFNHSAVLGWKDGILQFDNADFFEIIDQLSRWYGVEFKVDQALRIEGKYTGSYRKESLENVLKGISFSSDFDFIIKNKEVFITKPKKRNS